MKQNILTTILTMIILAATIGASFAQRGEVDRFGDVPLESKTNVVKMFPNPSIDFLNVRIENSNLSTASFTVHNIIGNVVDVDIEVVGKGEFVIKVKDLSPGYYFLGIRDDQGYFKETYKFLKR